MICTRCNREEATTVVSERVGQEWREAHLCKSCVLKEMPGARDFCRACRKRPGKFWATDPGTGKLESFRLCEECARRAGWQPTAPTACGGMEAMAAYGGPLRNARRKVAQLFWKPWL